MTSTSKDVNIVYLENLQRRPTSEEEVEAVNRIDYEGLFISDLVEEIQGTFEYRSLQGNYAGDLSYNNTTSTMTVTGLSATKTDSYSSVTLGNGKLAFIMSKDPFGSSRSFITTGVNENDKNDTKHITNVVEGFSMTTFRLFGSESTSTSIDENYRFQSLNMKTAVFTNTYVAKDNTGYGHVVNVVHETCALRPYPYCVLQTITLELDADKNVNDSATIDIFHEVVAPESLGSTEYYSNLIDMGQDENLYVFGGHGNTAKDSTLALASCYLFDGGSDWWSNKGYNINLNRPGISTAHTKFGITLQKGVQKKFHIICAMMSTADFPNPRAETTKILMGLSTKGGVDVRAEHVLQWVDQWKSCIEITPKDENDSLQMQEITTLEKRIRFSLYNIFSSIRDDIHVEVNPLNITTLDINGNIYLNGDMWLVPVLLFLKPAAAKNLLNQRYAMLESAKKMASAHGYRGSRYPYMNDTSGYTDMYWDSITPLHVFNTGILSINVWNYFRVTRDNDWLRKKGYSILRSNAEFFVSMIDSSGGIPNVCGINSLRGDNNSVTNYMAKLSIKYALEATYELNYSAPTGWENMMFSLPIPKLGSDGNGNNHIILVHEGYDSSGSDIRFLETLLILHPYYSKEFMSLSVNHTKETLRGNIEHYNNANLPHSSHDNHYFNRNIKSAIYGSIAQQESSYGLRSSNIGSFKLELDRMFGANEVGPWCVLKNFLSPSSTGVPGTSCSVHPTGIINDISISAAFLLNLITSIGGLSICGGISSSRYYYSPYEIKSKHGNVLPPTWKNMTIKGVGSSKSTVKVTNSMYHPSSCPI